MCSTAKSYNSFGVKIWFANGLCKLVLEASLLTVPPSPSQAVFPCEVAKNCHSASIPKSA